MSVWIGASLMLNEMEMTIDMMLMDTPAKGLSAVQIHILGELYAKDHQRPSDLALAVGRAATSFTPVLDLLETLNLIKRTPDQNDRRAVTISLTVKAKALREPIEKVLSALEDWYSDSDWPVQLERTAKPIEA